MPSCETSKKECAECMNEVQDCALCIRHGMCEERKSGGFWRGGRIIGLPIRRGPWTKFSGFSGTENAISNAVASVTSCGWTPIIAGIAIGLIFGKCKILNKL